MWCVPHCEVQRRALAIDLFERGDLVDDHAEGFLHWTEVVRVDIIALVSFRW